LRIMSRLRGGGGRLGRYGYRLVNGGPFAFATGPTFYRLMGQHLEPRRFDGRG
jgi:hypothetical protein